MTCPFLEEIVVRYCKACSVKKMIPSSSLTSESKCFKNFEECPLFKEITKPAKNGSKECIWAKHGIVSYRLCTKNFDCKSCEFDQLVMDKNGKLKESQDFEERIKKEGIKVK
jgi:hypothetical protein